MMCAPTRDTRPRVIRIELSNISSLPAASTRRINSDNKQTVGQLPSVHKGILPNPNPNAPSYSTSISLPKPLEQPLQASSEINPYTRPSPIKCHRCNHPGHKSNECPRRKALLLEGEEHADSGATEDKEDWENAEAELVEGDSGDPSICTVEQLLYNRHPKQSQRHSICQNEVHNT